MRAIRNFIRNLFIIPSKAEAILDLSQSVYISHINTERFSPETSEYFFKVYFGSGLVIKLVTTKRKPTLENLRELFIYNFDNKRLILTQEDLLDISLSTSSRKGPHT